MVRITELGPRLGIAPTCAALGVARATYYRRRRPRCDRPRRPACPRALGSEERAAVLAVLHEPRFVDLAPAEVYATLLDEGRYLCSERTMYRNTEHHHSGLGLLTPPDVHHGVAEQRVAARATVLATVYAAHPERFPAGRLHPPAPPVEVWINPPTSAGLSQTVLAPPPSRLARRAAFA